MDTKLPVTPMLGVSLFFTGITWAATLPYAGIMAVDVLGIDNASYALLMTASSIVGALASLALGYFSDKVRDRRLFVIGCGLLGALGFGLIYTLRTPLAYGLAYCVIMPLGFALFSQTFSYARTFYNLNRPERAEFMNSVLRSIFTVAWVVVPPVAGWLAATYTTFDVYGVAAAAYFCCAMIFGFMLTDPATRIGFDSRSKDGFSQPEAARGIELPMLIGIGGVFLTKIAYALHTTTTPLAITNDLGGTLTDVGMYASLGALLEVPCMLAWGLLAQRVPKWTIIVAAALIYGLYLILLGEATTVATVLWLQILKAISTAALLSITISYMQESIRGRVGLSTSLLDVTMVASNMTAAAIFAAATLGGSYRPAFLVGGLLAVAGAVTLVLAHGVVGRRQTAAR
jgi:SET family sugar efflux transporter-like MFS transporter